MTSSAKSISLLRTLHTLVLAFTRARLNTFLSVLVCKQIPSVGELRAYDSIREKNVRKIVIARTRPCFTPLRLSNGSVVVPS